MLKANAHNYNDVLDDVTKARVKEQYGVEAETWGDAIKARVGDQNGGFSKTYPNGSFVKPHKNMPYTTKRKYGK